MAENMVVHSSGSLRRGPNTILTVSPPQCFLCLRVGHLQERCPYFLSQQRNLPVAQCVADLAGPSKKKIKSEEWRRRNAQMLGRTGDRQRNTPQFGTGKSKNQKFMERQTNRTDDGQLRVPCYIHDMPRDPLKMVELDALSGDGSTIRIMCCTPETRCQARIQGEQRICLLYTSPSQRD